MDRARDEHFSGYRDLKRSGDEKISITHHDISPGWCAVLTTSAVYWAQAAIACTGAALRHDKTSSSENRRLRLLESFATLLKERVDCRQRIVKTVLRFGIAHEVNAFH